MQAGRRPLTTRDTRWAAALASFFAHRGVRPNTISGASLLFAAGAGACLWRAGNPIDGATPWLFVGAALLIQLRLLCNLLDGMVAIEGGLKSKTGEIFNELPDRFADVFILAGAGYCVTASSWTPLLGWQGVIFALLTAYVRALGVSAGAGQKFCGPMAKPHRMAVITVASVASAVLAWRDILFPVMAWALGVVVIGCAVTICRRTFQIMSELESR